MNNSRIRQLTRLARARSEEYRHSNAALSTAFQLEEQRQQQARISNLANGFTAAGMRTEQLAEHSVHQIRSPLEEEPDLDATIID